MLKDNLGIMVRVKVVKNKVAPPFRQVEFDVHFGSGIDTYGCLLDAAETLGVIERKGSWLGFNTNPYADPNTKTNPKSSKKKKVNEKNKFGLLVGVAAAAALLAMVGGAAVLRKRRMDAVEENMDAVEDQFLQYTELPDSAVATEAGPGNGE